MVEHVGQNMMYFKSPYLKVQPCAAPWWRRAETASSVRPSVIVTVCMSVFTSIVCTAALSTVSNLSLQLPSS